MPAPEELRRVVLETAAEWGAQNGRREVATTNKALDLLIRNLAGLTVTDARRLALKAIADDGAITDSDMPEVMRAKYELLGRDSPLTFEYETAKFSEIGGMARLRSWLEVSEEIFMCGGHRSAPSRRWQSCCHRFVSKLVQRDNATTMKYQLPVNTGKTWGSPSPHPSPDPMGRGWPKAG